MSDEYDIDSLLRFDPLDTAEKLVGTDDQDTVSMVGLALAIRHNATKEKVLTARGDTSFSCSVDRYLSVVNGLGFERVLLDHFNRPSHDDAGREVTEFLAIYARPDGLLLRIDTYGDLINSANIYFNVSYIPEDRSKLPLCSGHTKIVSSSSHVWVGHQDVREALRHKIESFEKVGSFTNPWVERPFLWLLNYQDTKVLNCDYEEINADRISRMPEWVRNMITVRDEDLNAV